MKTLLLRWLLVSLINSFGSASLCAFVLLLTSTVNAQCPIEDQIEGQYLIQYKQSPSFDVHSKAQRSSFEEFLFHQPENVEEIHTQNLNTTPYKNQTDTKIQSKAHSETQKLSTYFVKAEPAQIETFKSDSSIVSIEPNCAVYLQNKPSDSFLEQQMNYLSQLKMESVWEYSTGSPLVIVAVSDTGIDLNHEDLIDNLWTNHAELNGVDGVDDDQNGYIDDIHGYDFADNDGDPSPGDNPDSAHGTHVAGLIGAVGNNQLGISGLNWNVKLMSLKGFTDTGKGDLAAMIKTIYYAVDNGAQIINCSWGAKRNPTLAEIDAFNYASQHGVFVVTAAGNQSDLADLYSPASLDTVVAVGSINSQNELSSFSNFGKKVALLAPGGDIGSDKDESIFSTLPEINGSYGIRKGTSISTPLVAGVAALLLSIKPTLNPIEIKNILLQSADEQLDHTTLGSYHHKRLNPLKAIQLLLNENSVYSCSDCYILNETTKNHSSHSSSLGSCNMKTGEYIEANVFTPFLIMLLPFLLIILLRRLF